MAKTNKQTFILTPGVNEAYRQMLDFLQQRNQLIPWKVTIQEYKPSRSDAQLRLCWMWMAEYAAAYGETKEQSYNRFKYKCCLPIMLADEDSKFDHLRYIWNLVRNDPEGKAAVVKLIHTSDLSVPQMAEALTEFQFMATSQGFTLSDPEELRQAREAA